MFHPIGSRPPTVYWRRRLSLCGVVLGLVLLAVWVLRPGADRRAAAAPAPTRSTQQSAPSVAVSPSTQPMPSATGTRNPSGSATPSRSGPLSHSALPPPLARCTTAALKVAAVVDRANYSVGDQPVVELQVTNTGLAPCVQDLADSQVELRVYNGESRVWGSHDCTVEPGTSDHPLAVGQPVRVSIVWSGLSSQPKCAGTRQRVGAGTYTLYASLSGRVGTATQFSIS